MKILHQLGHNHKWSLDAFFEYRVGDGFILSAYSFDKDKVGDKLSGYKPEQYLPHSLIDLQFYGSKASNGENLKSYPFHPINFKKGQATEVSVIDSAIAGVEYQEKLGLREIVIPNVYIEPERGQKVSELVRILSAKIKKGRKEGLTYFLTVPISGTTVREDTDIEKLLQELTDMDVSFDGYYIVCEPNLETRKKISVDYKYYSNLNRVIATLKKQGFKIILGFANVDALVFAALNDLDFVSIGTYENLRNFDIKRFTESKGGGPSDGWYYSDKLMNFIKAKQLEVLRERGGIDLVANEDNIFSDIILKDGYPWNTHRPDVHKNYLLAISRQLAEVASGKDRAERIAKLEAMIECARTNYRALEDKGIILDDESVNYHLPLWQTILKTPSLGVTLKK